MDGNELFKLGDAIWTEAYKLYNLVCKNSYKPLEYASIKALMDMGIDLEQQGLELSRLEMAGRKEV
jgi:hypothetical protein